MSWVINPYSNIGPLAFGMPLQAVVSIVGPNGEFRRQPSSVRYLAGRNKPIVIFEDDKLVEVSFTRDFEDILDLRGIDPFADQPISVLRALATADGGPLHECMGFVLFFALGVSVSGFHDGDTDQEAITVFERGRWDELKSEMRPFNLK